MTFENSSNSKALMRVHISTKSDLNITTTTTTTHYDKERGGRRKSSFAAEGEKCNSRRCCFCCWRNDVIANIIHRVHTHTHGTTDRTTNLLISSNVHYIHLGGDKNVHCRLQSITTGSGTVTRNSRYKGIACSTVMTQTTAYSPK